MGSCGYLFKCSRLTKTIFKGVLADSEWGDGVDGAATPAGLKHGSDRHETFRNALNFQMTPVNTIFGHFFVNMFGSRTSFYTFLGQFWRIYR